MEPVEKKKRRKTTAKNSSPPSTYPSFSLLPDEITVNCLARIPRSYYPRLSIVSRTFRSLLSSTELYAARSNLRNIEECLYVCLWDPRHDFPEWFTLWINPNRIKKRKKRVGQLLVPIPSSDFASMAKPIAVGSEIYVIGGPIHNKPSSAVRVLDCRSHTWRDAPSMNVARIDAFTCVYNGKIYVIGGLIQVKDDQSLYAEVFDTKTQTWECLPDPGSEIRKCYVSIIAEIDGTINFGYCLKMYGYNTKQGKWETCVNIDATFARSKCVIENEAYNCGYNLEWEDINGGYSKVVKGLGSLRDMYRRKGGSTYGKTTKAASCGGKLYLMWEGYRRRSCGNNKKIWCVEISLEKRDEGEIWGNVEWIDAVHIVPRSCELLHFLTVSV